MPKQVDYEDYWAADLKVQPSLTEKMKMTECHSKHSAFKFYVVLNFKWLINQIYTWQRVN